MLLSIQQNTTKFCSLIDLETIKTKYQNVITVLVRLIFQTELKFKLDIRIGRKFGYFFDFVHQIYISHVIKIYNLWNDYMNNFSILYFSDLLTFPTLKEPDIKCLE